MIVPGENWTFHTIGLWNYLSPIHPVLMFSHMDTNQLVDSTPRQALAGIGNTLRSQEKIRASGFKYSLMACFAMQNSGSMDSILEITKAVMWALLTTSLILSITIRIMLL